MPGRIHPSDAPRSDDAAEALVWKALKDQLPDDWEAWHSLKVRTTRKQFGEGDFIVADPERGYLAVEVKGGKIQESKGRWFYEGGRQMPKAPLKQAHDYVEKLQDELERVWPNDRVRRGVACCLPETPAENRPTNSDTRDLIIDAIEVGDIIPALRRAFDATIVPGNAPPDKSWMEALTRLWGESWEPRVGLLGRARLREQAKSVLNEQQLGALRGLAKQRRMIVSGGAGTGKSTVAMRIAEERAWNSSVRYLCFTLPLARWVDQQLAIPRQNDRDARAQTVHGLALELAESWNLDVPREPASSEEWKAVMNAVHQQSADRAVERPDVLLIDEAQSFSNEDWALVDRLHSDEGWLWIFRDPAQSYWEKRSMPERYSNGVIEYELQKQERMPRSLDAVARAYSSDSVNTAINAFDPDTLVAVRANGDPRPVLTREIDRLLELGFKPAQIAIITLAGQTTSQVFGDESIGDHRVVNADHEDAPESIVVETFLRFQGLDRTILLLCEGHLDTAEYRYSERMHMALTRATTAVVVLADDKLWQRDEVLSKLRDSGKLELEG